MKEDILPYEFPSKFMLIATVLLSLFYITWWLQLTNRGNTILYALLFFGEIFHVTTALLFAFTVRKSYLFPQCSPLTSEQFTVDIFIPVVNEPLFIVAQTIEHAKALPYQNKQIYVLNDGYVAGNQKWRKYESLAQREHIHCITRRKKGGAKAGNINHALSKTTGELLVIIDADMQLSPEFLSKTLPYFQESNLAFVQTPQWYQNASTNVVSNAASHQQDLFFGPVMCGKHMDNAAFICGTNVVIRRSALEQIGGFAEESIAEDILTSVHIHANGWKSIYIPIVLAKGLAPEDIHSYTQQQFRWARGSLELLFRHNPLFMHGLTITQKLHYISSTIYYLNGIIIAIDASIPLIFFYLHIVPVNEATTTFAFYFLPFLFVNLLLIRTVSKGNFTLNAMAFSHSLWFVQLLALLSRITGKSVKFQVTPKLRNRSFHAHLSIPHLLYCVIGIVGVGIAVQREGLSSSVVTNTAWYLFVALLFIPFILQSWNIQLYAQR